MLIRRTTYWQRYVQYVSLLRGTNSFQDRNRSTRPADIMS